MSKPTRVDVWCEAEAHKPAPVLRFRWVRQGDSGFWEAEAISGPKQARWAQEIATGRTVIVRDDKAISTEQALLTPGAYRHKWILRCDKCGLDLQVRDDRLEPYLDALAEAGVSRVDLERLARSLQ